MKNLIKVFVVVLIATSALFLTNCAGVNVSGFEPLAKSTVAPFDQNNFVVVQRVKGEHSSKRILGIGGLSDMYLRQSAISNMYDNAHLTGSQTIIDINVIKSFAFIVGPVYMQEIYTATGTVIEFVGPHEDIHTAKVQVVE